MKQYRVTLKVTNRSSGAFEAVKTDVISGADEAHALTRAGLDVLDAGKGYELLAIEEVTHEKSQVAKSNQAGA